jgi:hypothetical protein
MPFTADDYDNGGGHDPLCSTCTEMRWERRPGINETTGMHTFSMRCSTGRWCEDERRDTPGRCGLSAASYNGRRSGRPE